MTISENLFERFCRENEISFSRIAPVAGIGIKSPDYEIIINDRHAIVEVKQLNPNSNDKKSEAQTPEQGAPNVREVKTANRIRKIIDDAMPQLQAQARKGFPAIIFLYSNIPINGRYISPQYILRAMYGKEIGELVLPNDNSTFPYVRNIRFGGSRKVSRDYNTSLSAIVLMFEDWDHYELHAHFYHNIFNSHRFNPDWFCNKRVRHFCLPNVGTGMSPEWIEI